ncbi:MAG: hypothetical protein AAF456_07340 [Planctomycetota bacterium]
MSLKFGIYLVEQRIITPEQFCGLVKIQQEATKGLPTLAVEKNYLTIKQVANILDAKELAPQKTFDQLAIEMDYLEPGDTMQLLQLQQISCPTIEQLVVECGLLTQRQASVLTQHFSRQAAVADTPARTQPQEAPQTTEPAPQPVPETAQPINTGRPKAPKFKQRPVIVHPYTPAEY